MQLEVPLSWESLMRRRRYLSLFLQKPTNISLLVPSTKSLTLGTVILCAIRLPHTNTLTFHTILRVYINTII